MSEIEKLKEIERKQQEELKQTRTKLKKAKAEQAKKDAEARNRWLALFGHALLEQLNHDPNKQVALSRIESKLKPAEFKLVQEGLIKEGVLENV